MELGGTEKVTTAQMAKLDGTDSQTLKFRFCVSWQQNVGHTKLGSTDMDSVAPVWWKWLDSLSYVKLGGSEI